MLHIFFQLQSFVKLRPQTYFIDNWIFQLHYRITTLFFFLATILVTLRHYFGEHISCINDLPKSGYSNVVNNYCFFTSTFTVIKEHDNKYAAHPGVGPYGIGSTEPIRRHSYYQWVPFALFAQGIMFHLTHLLWKHCENGTIKKLIDGLDRASFSLMDKEVQGGDGSMIPPVHEKQKCMNRIRHAFVKRIVCNRTWARWLIFCEILNVLNVAFQAYVTHLFLGRQFYSLGRNLISKGPKVLDEVFPKMTKCTFHMYGPSGSIQLHDSLCIMALNIINEKIYVGLWCWFVCLFALSCAAIVWRILTVFLHSKSVKFNQLVFAANYLGKIHRWNVDVIMKRFSFTDWIFLKYLAKNMDALVFRELFLGLIQDLEEDKKPLVGDNYYS